MLHITYMYKVITRPPPSPLFYPEVLAKKKKSVRATAATTTHLCARQLVLWVRQLLPHCLQAALHLSLLMTDHGMRITQLLQPCL